ncbi:MAG TPA: 3-deoxy-D-manno-octulosonic acid transferase [Terriglobales bacterium]|nr:3-deoxy-D-manno-octulosonic acid transferase [Terriglobales bacterium]
MSPTKHLCIPLDRKSWPLKYNVLSMHLLYSALLTLVLLLGLPWWLLQMLRNGKYRAGLGERFGLVPDRIRQDNRPVIWVHAVSVGEVLAVDPLIRQLQEQNPLYRVLISTTTSTGQKLARDRFGAKNVFYFPLDFAFAVRRYLSALRPEMIVIAETEFWPNFLRLAHGTGARVLVVNARISDRSFPRYRKWRSFIAPMLRNVDRFLTQTDVDRGRLIEIGALAERVSVSGNLKFDIMPAKAVTIVGHLQVVFKRDRNSPIVVCGSTVEGEEPILIDSFRNVVKWYPNAVMILAPRHPERWPQVVELLRASKLPWKRRSEWNHLEPIGGSIFLLDTIGELAAVYQLATVAFVGGSLVPRGGHNILEPAHYATPVMVGPHTENFREIVDLFVRAGAVNVVTPEKFGDQLLRLLDQPAKRVELGRHAAEVVRATCGATNRTLDVLNQYLRQPATSVDPPVPRAL